MRELHQFLDHHTVVAEPTDQPQVDLVFFQVAARGQPSAQALRQLLQSHQDKGAYGRVDVLDGKEHTYLELGGWLGNQGAALRLMGLGQLLGLWQLLTPRNMLGAAADDALVQQMAGAGYISVVATRAVAAA